MLTFIRHYEEVRRSNLFIFNLNSWDCFAFFLDEKARNDVPINPGQSLLWDRFYCILVGW